jgi:calpain-15
VIGSIYDENDDIAEEEKETYDSLEWKRITEIIDDPQMIVDGIHPNDIKQGYLGDCYLLAVMSAMCEFPEQIYDLLGTKEANKSGIYCIFMYINGIKRPVIIDDLVPVYKNSKEIAFCSSHGGEIWPILIEKAWAKMHGT